MPKINPDIPANSVQYFSNARGVYYLPSMKTEWERSGYLPRLDYESAYSLVNAAVADGKITLLEGVSLLLTMARLGKEIFTGANSASIWHYYNESDHEDSVKNLKKLGINCVRTPLSFAAYEHDPDNYLKNVKSFLTICDRHKIRVQFILWDADYSDATLYSEDKKYTEQQDWTQPDLGRELAVEHPRNPFLARVGSWGGVSSFVQASSTPYLEALAESVSSYQSMWCFDLCNKPVMPTYKNLVLSSHNTLNQSLSSTDIKYTISFKNGINIFNDTGYLDNGKGTGPSGSYEIRDIQDFSGIIDFVSVPFIANNDYAFKRYLNGAISGAAVGGISKPFMVYAAYDPELGQNFNSTVDLLNSSSVGYFNDIGIVDSVFSFGKSREKFGNIYWDGQYKDLNLASSVLSEASSVNWYNRKQLTKYGRLKTKSADPTNASAGFFSGVPLELESFKDNVYVSANKTDWEHLKDFYVNSGDSLKAVIGKTGEGSKTFRAPYSSEYNDSIEWNVLASSFFRNTTEENLRILHNFDTYFPPLSSYTYATGGENWQKINKTIVLRNGFLQSLAKFVADYDSSSVGYAELRNTEYDTNPIPDYERGELTELIEVMTNPYDLTDRNPTTDRLNNILSIATPSFLANVFYDPDADGDYRIYFDNYFNKLVTQLKKCFMWLYWKGSTDSEFKVVSDSFLSEISFEPSSISSVEIYTSAVTSDDENPSEDAYIAGSLSSVQSPLYSVEVYNPSSQEWEDSFVFVVSGQSREIIYQQTVDSNFSGYWAPSGSRAPVSFTTFGASGMAKVRVKKTGGQSISSVEVYPKRYYKYRPPTTFTYGSDTSGIELTAYIGDKLYLEIDNSTSSPLCIFADPFKPPIPEGLTDYQGQTRLDYISGTVDLTSSTGAWSSIPWGSSVFTSLPPSLYFGPGVHLVSAGLPVSSNSTIYVDANAYIIGGFDVFSGYDCKFIGRGVISSEAYPRSFIKNEVFDNVASVACGFYLPIGMSVSTTSPYSLNATKTPGAVVEGLVLANQAFYGVAPNTCNSLNHCKHIAPWTYNSDGATPYPRLQYSFASVTNCIQLCGDDPNLPFGNRYKGSTYYRNNFVGNYRSSIFTTYFGGGMVNKTVVKDIDAICYAFSGSNHQFGPFCPGALLNIYVDAPSSLSYDTGLNNVDIFNIDVRGGDGSAVYMPMFHIANQKYIFPGPAQKDAVGVISGINISHWNISPSAHIPEVTTTSSTIYGLSAGPLPGQTHQGENRPRDITFTNYKIGSNLFLTPDNVDDYVAWVNPTSSLISVTDPDSVDGSSAGIVFKTT